MTDNKSTEAGLEQGHYWTQWGISGQWAIMYWRDGYFWDDSDAGFARDKFVVGPRVYSPHEQRQIDAYLADAIAELKSIQQHFDSRILDNAIGMIEAARAPILDAVDNALADEAKAESAGKPTMPDDLVGKVLAGEISALKAWRCAAGLSQADLAERANISARYLIDIENGSIDPLYSTLRKIATALGLGVDDIMPM